MIVGQQFAARGKSVATLHAMRRVMKLTLDQPLPTTDVPVRTVRADDAEALAHLMLAAYRGTIDYHDETIDDARAEVAMLFDDTQRTLLADCSFVVERDDSLASAAIIIRHDGEPLVAFSMTDPRWKRIGLARTCLTHSINALTAHGWTTLRLIVTPGNTPAERMYESMGFVDDA